MAKTLQDKKDDAKLRLDTKDEDLCKEIVEVLGRDVSRRVLLAGEAGIGKTRLAKMVGDYAINHGLYFLTLCLHLNKKFEDQWSLYENIASQLSVYSDFEETEVDDRDEDEDEEQKATNLEELKKNIIIEIKQREKVLAHKEKAKAEAEKVKNAGKNVKETANKNTPVGKEKSTGVGNKPAEGEQNDISTGYLLLILDDEGNKTTEDEVMKKLELEKFLREHYFLNNHTRLKIIVTRRKGDQEPTKSGGEIEAHDTKSEKGSEDQEEAKSSEQGSDDQEEAKSNEQGSEEQEEAKSNEQGSEEQEEAKSSEHGSEEQKKAKSSEQGRDGQEEAKSDREIQPAGETESQHKKEKSEPQALAKAQVTDRDGEIVPSTGDEPKVATKIYDVIVFHTTDESHVLLNSINEAKLKDLYVHLTTVDWEADDAKLISDIVEKSKNSPAAIFVLAKSLNQITRSTSHSGIEKDLKDKMKEVLSADRSDSFNPILHLAYVLLETYGPSKNAILDCFWHSLDFFEHCGCVYYREMITQWILEGYFDPVRSVEKAYQNGHSILMELINRGILKIQENNVVVPEMAMSNLIDPRRRGHLGRSRLAFSRVYAGEKRKGIGKTTQIDDMIQTVQAKKVDKITTILVSGDRLRRETPEKYFKKLGDLEVLGLFEPTLEPFVMSFLNLLHLRVLVIRDCDLLTDIEDLKAFRELNALEVSGASSLKKISDEFFKALSKLQSLHFSGLQITSSPSSISLLTELHCLIIKDCPLLESLPDIQELVKLEVVDVSGARGLQTCFDNTKGEKKNKSKNKNFYHLTKLQLLDFSESQIERLPIFQDAAEAKKLHSVTRLLLRDCSKLRRLPSLKPLSGLQILDLSGTTNLVEMLEVCFEDKKELRTLNLSRTNLSELATTIEELSSLNELLLKDSTNLEVLPNIQKLTNLEFIDVSGCTKLHTIEGSFEDMYYLREVNLAGTKVTILPEFLPKESKILCLKRITLADGRSFEGENWEIVKKSMPSKTSEAASSSDTVVKSQEISEKESKETGEIQPNEPCASDCTQKEDAIGERLLKLSKDKAVYKKILSLFPSASPEEVMEIHESKDLSEEALANAESVSFVDITSTRLTSIFNQTKSVKGCWLRMCIDIKDLFSGVAAERLKSLETLSITNLPSLETISCGSSLKKLETLSIDCCPNVKTLFSDATQIPSSLKDLYIKHCEKMEKIVEGGEVSTLTKLKVEYCPNFKGGSEISDWVVVDHRDASPQE